MKTDLRAILLASFAALCAAALPSCSAPETDVVLRPEESFTWSGRTVRFSPPPKGWAKRDFVDGDKRGIQFLLDRGEHERGFGIAAGELNPFGMSERIDRLRRLVAAADSMTPEEVAAHIRQLRIPPARFISAEERSRFQLAEAILDQADYTNRRLMTGDTIHLLGEALSVLQDLDYTLEDVVDRVLPEVEPVASIGGTPDLRGEPEEIDGRPAWRVEYRAGSGENRPIAREVWILSDGRLFFIAYWGDESGLEVFERVAGTVRFPATAGA